MGEMVLERRAPVGPRAVIEGTSGDVIYATWWGMRRVGEQS